MRVSTVRRDASEFFLAVVTMRSTNGLSSLARATVVVMASSRTSERARLRRSATRWPFLRPNVLPLRGCFINLVFSILYVVFRIGYKIPNTGYYILNLSFVVAEREAHVGKCAFDILQTLLTETLDGEEVVLALADQAADRADGSVVERLLYTLRHAELRDAGLQDLGVHSAAFVFAAARAFGDAHQGLRCLVLLESDDGLELVNHCLDGAFERFAGGEGAVGLDDNAQAVEIRAVTDTHVLDFVVDAADGREYRIECDGADFDAFLLMHFFGDVAESALCAQLHLERHFAGDVGNVLFRIQDFDLAGKLQVCSGHLLGAFDAQRNTLGFIGQKLEADLTDIEEDSDDVLLDTFNGGELMRNARELHVRDRSARKRRKNDAAQRVAECVAVARIEAVYLVGAASLGFGDNAGFAGQCNVIIGHIKIGIRF